MRKRLPLNWIVDLVNKFLGGSQDNLISFCYRKLIQAILGLLRLVG